MCRFLRTTIVFAMAVSLPALASAQASIAGVVRDTSGAVLPGVTVEAASPALIEKIRSVITDGTGQYRIVDLRPGVYTVTFALAGFNTVKREGIELSGSFVATVNADLRVGALEETITVTGESPTVDVQTTTKQKVLDHTVMDAIPSGRFIQAMGVLTPGIQLAAGAQDVGGSTGDALDPRLAVHGSKADSQRLTQNGISMTAGVGTGGTSSAPPNLAAMQEVTLDFSGISAESTQGGVRVNFVPRDGGNKFAGTFFGAFANDKMQGSNYSQDLKDRGLSTPDSIKKNWDINPGFGGPISKDKLWFYMSVRYNGADNNVAGIFYNVNANNPNVWTYVADLNRPGENNSVWKNATTRLTWQANPKNKIGFTWFQDDGCRCPWTVSATLAPEAARKWYFPMQRQLLADWMSPVTNRLLLEAVATQRVERLIMGVPDDLNHDMISVVEQSTGLMYRARNEYANNFAHPFFYRAAMSYITGAHAFKVGFNDGQENIENGPFDIQPVSYRFNNGVPNQITERAYPAPHWEKVNHDLGLYAQDKWTVNRLTVSGGIRFDYFASSFPEQHLGPGLLVPTRDLTIPAQDNLRWKDVTPRIGVSYDVRGNGKTAIKATINKYLSGEGTGSLAQSPNPSLTIVLNTTRSWTDANRDFVPQCDLVNPAANGECGAMANPNFGKAVPGTRFDPEVLGGWSQRSYNWEFSTGVQHEILPRVSVDAGYYRRWFGNFIVTDNLAVAPSDYDRFSITTPADPRLPNGGGYTLGGLYDLNPSKFGIPTQNYVTHADTYGKQIDHWNGVDVSVNARLQNGLLFQGGTSTGRTSTDNCEVVAQVPEALFNGAILTAANPGASTWLPAQYCHQVSPFLTTVKLLTAYTIPKADVQISGALQSMPGPLVAANFNASTALVAQSLGRPLSGNAANITINLLEPGSIYGERLNQLDLRIGKILRFARTKAAVNLDLYNALNSAAVLAENTNFAVWRRPTSILTARFAKISAQIDF